MKLVFYVAMFLMTTSIKAVKLDTLMQDDAPNLSLAQVKAETQV